MPGSFTVTPGSPSPGGTAQAMNRFRSLDSGGWSGAQARSSCVSKNGGRRSVRVRAGVGRLLADLPVRWPRYARRQGTASCSVTLPEQLADNDEIDGTTGFHAAERTAAVVSTGDLRVEISAGRDDPVLPGDGARVAGRTAAALRLARSAAFRPGRRRPLPHHPAVRSLCRRTLYGLGSSSTACSIKRGRH